MRKDSVCIRRTYYLRSLLASSLRMTPMPEESISPASGYECLRYRPIIACSPSGSFQWVAAAVIAAVIGSLGGDSAQKCPSIVFAGLSASGSVQRYEQRNTPDNDNVSRRQVLAGVPTSDAVGERPYRRQVNRRQDNRYHHHRAAAMMQVAPTGTPWRPKRRPAITPAFAGRLTSMCVTDGVLGLRPKWRPLQIISRARDRAPRHTWLTRRFSIRR